MHGQIQRPFVYQKLNPDDPPHLDSDHDSAQCPMAACVDCGGETSWDGDVCSTICTSCGTLQDPTQSVLSSHLEQQDSGRQYDPLWNPSSLGPLKSGRSGWNLVGQSKEVRKQKNMVRICSGRRYTIRYSPQLVVRNARIYQQHFLQTL